MIDCSAKHVVVKNKQTKKRDVIIGRSDMRRRNDEMKW